MDIDKRVLAGLGVVIIVAAVAALLLMGGGEGPSTAGYSDFDSYRGEMLVETTVTGTTTSEWAQRVYDNGTVRNLSERPPGEVVDVRNVTRRMRGPDGEAMEATFRVYTVEFQGVLVNRTVSADVIYRPDYTLRYDYTNPPESSLVTAVVRGNTSTLYRTGGRSVETNTSALGIETLGMGRDLLPRLSDGYGTERAGTATVSGRQTTVYDVTSTPGSDGPPVSRVWVDDEYGVPVKVQYEASRQGDTVTTNVTLSNLEFNAGVQEADFEVDESEIPAEPPTPIEEEVEGFHGGEVNASEVIDYQAANITVETESFDSIEAARNAFGGELLVPETLPSGFEFRRAELRTERFTTNDTIESRMVNLMYGNVSRRMMIRQMSEEPEARLRGAENITVEGADARYLSQLGDIGIIRWECAGQAVELSGDLSRSTLVGVAESMPCS